MSRRFFHKSVNKVQAGGGVIGEDGRKNGTVVPFFPLLSCPFFNLPYKFKNYFTAEVFLSASASLR